MTDYKELEKVAAEFEEYLITLFKLQEAWGIYETFPESGPMVLRKKGTGYICEHELKGTIVYKDGCYGVVAINPRRKYYNGECIA